jgi:hypothetical protein
VRRRERARWRSRLASVPRLGGKHFEPEPGSSGRISQLRSRRRPSRPEREHQSDPGTGVNRCRRSRCIPSDRPSSDSISSRARTPRRRDST